MQKATIPKALREQVWLTHVGRHFDHKCYVPWCQNRMTVFDFQVGHDIPESRGGATELFNLRPICSRCNLSMGSHYTIREWSALSRPPGCWSWLSWRTATTATTATTAAIVDVPVARPKRRFAIATTPPEPEPEPEPEPAVELDE